MKRREFIRLVGGAVAWPLGAHAQQPTKIYRIGILYVSGSSSSNAPHLAAAFSAALQELGWSEGRNIIFEYRNAESKTERLHELAREFVHLNVDVIVAFNTLAARAAKQAMSTIPIVMIAGSAIGDGLVTSLAQRGGNITGLSHMTGELGAKRLQILKEVVPGISRVAVLWNADTRTGAPSLGMPRPPDERWKFGSTP